MRDAMLLLILLSLALIGLLVATLVFAARGNAELGSDVWPLVGAALPLGAIVVLGLLGVLG